MSTFSKSQYTNSVGSKSSRAEAQDFKKCSPVPRSGMGRGARFKYLQSEPNLDLCITREIENAVGTAHRMAPFTARYPSVRPEDQVELVRGDQVEQVRGDQVELVRGDHVELVRGDQVELVRGDQVELVRGDQVEQVRGDQVEQVRGDQVELVRGDQVELVRGDQVELVRGTSRGWIPMEFREKARKKDPTILEDLAAPEEEASWGTGDRRTGDKNLVLSPCGRYWTVDNRNTLGDFIPQVPKVKATGTLNRVSADKEEDDKRETSSEMVDSMYSTVPSTVCSSDSSFHIVLTAEGDGEDQVEKSHI